MEPPRRSPLSEIHDRERKRRIRRCLRDGQSLLDPEDDELATRQAEWDIRRRNPWRWVLHGAVLVAGVVALGLFEEWRVRRRARRWLGRQGMFRDPSPLA